MLRRLLHDDVAHLSESARQSQRAAMTPEVGRLLVKILAQNIGSKYW